LEEGGGAREALGRRRGAVALRLEHPQVEVRAHQPLRGPPLEAQALGERQRGKRGSVLARKAGRGGGVGSGGRQLLRLPEVARGLRLRAQLPEREAELIVDLPQVVVAAGVLLGGL